MKCRLRLSALDLCSSSDTVTVAPTALFTVDKEREDAQKIASERKKRDAQTAENAAEWLKILPQWEKE